MTSAEWWDLIQAIGLAACTWYVRRGSRVDSFDVKLNTSSVDQVRRLHAEVALIRSDVGMLKDHYFETNKVSVDDRGSV